jgi:signal transduction histidine kinase
MKKRTIYFLIGSITVALIGMIVIQALWIRNAFIVKEEMFNRRVYDALGSVVDNLETQESMYYISRNYEGDSILQIVKAFSKDTLDNFQHRFDSLMASAEVANTETESPGKTAIPEIANGPNHIRYTYRYSGNQPVVIIDSTFISNEYQLAVPPSFSLNEFTFQWNEEIATIDSILSTETYFNSDPQRIEKEIRHILHINTPPGSVYLNKTGSQKERIAQQFEPFEKIPGAKPVHEKREEKIQKLEQKAKKIQEMIKQMAVALETKQAPVHQRINKNGLHLALSKALRDKGIELPFEFAVYSPSGDTNKIPIRSDGFSARYQTDAHRISLFPNDLFKKPDLLMVYFNGQKAHVMKSLLWLLAGSLLFTFIIVLASGVSFVVMIRQKKISDIKTDFINNMTHEFKTPIATISIAADSINNPRVLNEPETIRNFTRIIKEENNRMNTRVEQVLQMALLDSRDFKLKLTSFNMNSLIAKVAEHFSLQIEKRGGTLTRKLEATHTDIFADEDHIRNVLINLLDNANKYSVNNPDITVFSYNKSGKFIFGVEDKGIGMSTEAKRRVFDKFYRVATGNIHNIKGFGLGLSYVKAIVLAHHGEIVIESEPGKGSRFEICLQIKTERLIS